MGFIIETPPSPHIAGQATRLLARDFFLLVMASRASTRRARRQSSSLLPSSKHSHLEQGPTDLFRACSLTVRCVIVFSLRTKMDRREPARSHLRFCLLSQSRLSGCPCSVEHSCSPRKRVNPSNKQDPNRALPAQSKSTL